MEIIFNQNFIEKEELFINYTKKNYFSGDFVNAFCWFFQNKLIFWEDTYFQLMASMRKMKINIPLSYTPEMFENKIYHLFKQQQISEGRIKITVFRNSSHTPDLIIESLPYKDFFTIHETEVDVYKDVSIAPNLLSAISVFQPITSVAKQYALENNLQDLVLLNIEKRVARAVSGNLFFIKDHFIYSNSVDEGALISVLKKNFISFLHEIKEYTYKEEKLSPFQLLSAEEIFILSDKNGAIPIMRIRKNNFNTEKSNFIIKKFIGYSLKN